MKINSFSIEDIDLNGKVIILKEKILAAKYRTVGNRLHRATGGFGCNPSCIGKAVFTKCLGDGEESRWERSDFEGWITDQEAAALLEPTLTKAEA